MKCNNGLHGALFLNYKGEWSCLACGEMVDERELQKKREEAKKVSTTTDKKEKRDEDSQHKTGICN